MTADAELRGLADRWAFWAQPWCKASRDGECFAEDCGGKARPGWEQAACQRPHLRELDEEEIVPDRLDTYELSALLGWVSREMDRKLKSSNGQERWQLVEHIGHMLGGQFDDEAALAEGGLTWTLCEAAGWPQ